MIIESLRPIIDEILEVAADEDWKEVADRLIAEAHEATAADEPSEQEADRP